MSLEKVIKKFPLKIVVQYINNNSNLWHINTEAK